MDSFWKGFSCCTQPQLGTSMPYCHPGGVHLTIGGDRERWVVTRLGARETVCARCGHAEDDTGQALDKIAERVVQSALAGDQFAIAEIGNRLDGKAPQGLTLSGDADNPLQMRRIVEFVNGGKPNGHGDHQASKET